MKSRKTPRTLLGSMLIKLAPRIGAKVFFEPKWRVVGQIVFKNGKKRYFRYSSIDLNTLGASEVARDKDYTHFFMQKMGYPLAKGIAVYSDEWAKTISSKQTKLKAYKWAQKNKFPLIVKPNSGSQGRQVRVVYNISELKKALSQVFAKDRVALVQKIAKGDDYRLVVLDGKVISAYKRIPLNVVGDGKSNIYKLLVSKKKDLKKLGRVRVVKIGDPRIAETLKKQKKSWSYIPKKGEIIFLLPNANLSSGGDAEDVTKKIHKNYKDLAVRLTNDMGLRLCGVDLMIDGDIGKAMRKNVVVLELNAAPGLDNYARSGKVQQKIVEEMYLKILKSLAK